MKLSDYIAHFLYKEGIEYVFTVTGGASAHLIDSIDKHPKINFVCPQHEQGGAMAADGYARVTGNIGCAIATSGPGGTNLITGICSAYYDSIPALFITGQVSTFRMREDTGVRQIGFQETDIVTICQSVTKYAVQVIDPKMIRHELEKATHIARTGRPGPVLIDIPDNIQREEIDPSTLEYFIPPKIKKQASVVDTQLDRCFEFLAQAKRPIVVLGWGIHASHAEQEVQEFIEKSGLPFVPTWAIADILPSCHPQYVGTFGTHGTRFANFAVQNADMILAIGSRLDTKATGSPVSTFARGAIKVVVDIDTNELGKFSKYNLPIDLPINSDAKVFLEKLNNKLSPEWQPDIADWLENITKWKKKYPVCPDHYYSENEVNPYVFVKSLSREAKAGDIVIADTGCTLAWMMQAFEFKPGQRLFHDWNNTAMGWALPASIGACFAAKRKRIICVTGDGSLQMNIQELATVIRHKLPIKIITINNNGYGMIQQTQEQWLDSRYAASSIEGGLAFPDFSKLAEVYGYKTVRITTNKEISGQLQEVLAVAGPVFCDVKVSLKHRVIPQAKFGRPNEDLEPLLERREFLNNMLVEPLDVSHKS